MSRELVRRGPLGLGRGDAKAGARDRRNSDVSSSYIQVSDGVADVDLRKVDLTPAENALGGIVRRLQALQDAHNALLASLRNGQVINRDQPR